MTQGDVTFFALDTQSIQLGFGADQAAWLPAEIANATTLWKIVFGHHPFLSNGPHGNAGDYDGVAGGGEDMEILVNSYMCGQVDLYLSGHDHNMQWLQSPCTGTEFIVSGAGQSTYPLVGSNPAIFETDTTTGFVWIEIDSNILTAVFYDELGTELYRGQIIK
jgi:hypothetical protein